MIYLIIIILLSGTVSWLTFQLVKLKKERDECESDRLQCMLHLERFILWYGYKEKIDTGEASAWDKEIYNIQGPVINDQAKRFMEDRIQ